MSFYFKFAKSAIRSFFSILVLTNSTFFVFAAPGDLDPAFGSGGKVQTLINTEDRVYAMELQPDGKIIVGGRTRIGAGRFDFALARYNADGTLDSTFGSGGMQITALNASGAPDDEIYGVAIQPDGKILAVGAAVTTGGALAFTGIVRYQTNGILDPTFGTNGIVLVRRAVDRAIALQPDGKILCGGGFGEFVENNFQIMRLNPNGSTDAAFGAAGIVTIDFNGSGDGVWALALQPDGRIVAAGRSRVLGGDDNFAVARLNTDGSLDQTFGIGGKAVADFANDTDLGFGVALQTDGKIIVSGRVLPQINIFDFGLARFNSDGGIDTSFGDNGRVTTNFFNGVDTAFAVKVQSNGKIVAAGARGGIETAFGIARYNPNGSLDASFGIGGKVETFFQGLDEARALQIQPDGKIIAAGTARGGASIGSFALARYLGDPVAALGKSFDFDGDGRADQAVFRPSDRTWYLLGSEVGFAAAQFGLNSDIIAPADFDGDRKTDIAVFRNGVWYWLNSSDGGFNALQFGVTGDVPVSADYTGDGRAEPAVYRAGDWYTLNLTNNQFQAVRFGISSDKPIPADFDGDGKADFAVYRDGVWYMLRSTAGFAAVKFGKTSDEPVVGDYDGDGQADQAVYRAGEWYVLGSTQGFYAVRFGIAGDLPVAADYDGDGKTDIAVFREGVWYLLRSQQGFGAVQFGMTNDRPIPAAFIP